MLNGDQYRAVDTDGVHGGRHLVAGDLGWSVESADPRAAGVIAFVGVNLRIQCRHDLLRETERCAASFLCFTVMDAAEVARRD